MAAPHPRSYTPSEQVSAALASKGWNYTMEASAFSGLMIQGGKCGGLLGEVKAALADGGLPLLPAPPCPPGPPPPSPWAPCRASRHAVDLPLAASRPVSAELPPSPR